MKGVIENQNTRELELARLFEVEELEERMEFGSWTPEATAGGGGTIGGGENTMDFDWGLGIGWQPFK